MGKKLKLLIIISLLCNIVLLGFVFGHAYHRHVHKKDHPMMALLEEINISEQQRDRLKERLKNLRSAKKSMKEYHQAQALLIAPEFNALAYRNHLDNLLKERCEHMEAFTEIIVELATHLDQNERKKLAHLLKRGRK